MSVRDRLSRLVASAAFAALIVTALGMPAAMAQQPQPAQPPLNASTFLANPQQLLQQYPNGGPLMAGAVQQLALTDPATFKVILSLLPNASDLQKGAIGDGLAQAAKIEVLTNQTLAADWQNQIAAITDPTFKTAATNAFGDVRLGSIGGGTLGSAGGGILSGPAGTTGPAQPIGSASVPTQGFTYTS